jgi:hypothetical protein
MISGIMYALCMTCFIAAKLIYDKKPNDPFINYLEVPPKIDNRDIRGV